MPLRWRRQEENKRRNFPVPIPLSLGATPWSQPPIDHITSRPDFMAMEKTIRFGDLVRNSGRPQTVTLWTDPKKDRSLQEAIRDNRVLTVVQEPTSKHKDYGLLGFHQQTSATYLIFPRSLPPVPDSRVVGINFQLIEETKVTDPARLGELKTKTESKAQRLRPKPDPEPVKNTFTVRIRRTAVVETDVKVEAEDQATAEKKALNWLKHRPFEANSLSISQEVIKTS
jgi:hypothetical protein